MGLLAASWALSGCGAVRLAYNNAPELTYWWLDSLLDLDNPQSNRLRSDLDALHAWHRTQELPDVADSLKQLQDAAQEPLAAEQVCQWSRYLEGRYQAVLNKAAPTAIALAPTLRSAQVDHLAKAWDKRNTQWQKEWLEGTAQERLERRLKTAIERTEGLYGRLTDAQKTLLRSQLEGSPFDAATQYAEVLRRQKDALQTLRALQAGTPDEAQQQAAISALLARTMQPAQSAYGDYTETLRKHFCATAAQFHNTTSPAQRKKLQQTLLGYENDLRALVRN